MTADIVLTERRETVSVITVNRPAVMNALDLATLSALDTAYAAAIADDEVRAIVLTGAGEKAFIAGGDIADLGSRQGLRHYSEFAEPIHRLARLIETSDKPTLSAVNGWALGGGVELMLATDIRILAEEAKIGLPEINLGLFPGAGGSQRLIRQVPLCRAKELMFLGDSISATEAVLLGLANRTVPRADVLATTLEIAGRVATRSPLVLKLLKRSILHGGDMTLAGGLAYEQAMIGLVLDSGDAHEGCAAFLEKRQPAFTGA
jgi:enoyl-CoA hydratase